MKTEKTKNNKIKLDTNECAERLKHLNYLYKLLDTKCRKTTDDKVKRKLKKRLNVLYIRRNRAYKDFKKASTEYKPPETLT